MQRQAKPARALSPLGFTPRALRAAVAQLLSFLLLTQALVPRVPASPRALRAAGRASEKSATPAPAEAPAPAAAREPAAAVVPAGQSFGLVLKALTTPFNGHAGIDHHQPSKKLVVSAHAPAGQPHNFELIGADGEHREFTNIAGLAGELKVATARDDAQGLGLGGFRAGEMFTTTGAAGAVARVSPDGSAVQNPWVVLGGEGASAVGGLHVDRTGVFGGDLLAVTEGGEVWRVNASGTAALVADLNTPLSGVAAVPNDVARYGPWAGRALVGAKAQGAVYAVDPQGNAVSQQLGLGVEDIRLIPPHENFYGVDSETGALWGAPAAAFTGLLGDILVAQGSPGVLASVHWNGTEFGLSQVAQVGRWKQIAFSPAGLAEIPPVKQVYERIAVVRHAPVLNSGRVEGALWQLSPEPVTFDGNDTITSDLLVPGTPSVSVRDTGSKFSFGGVIQGGEGAQPAGYAVTLAGNASLRHLINRTDPISLAPVAAPPAPAGARDVSLSQAGQTAGDWATLRHLSLSGKAGSVAVPPGTYGKLSASGRTALVLGQENSAQPAQYNLEELSLAGGSELRVVGPVVITVRGNVTLAGSSVGAADDPRRVTLQISSGALSVTGSAVLYAVVRAPQSAVLIEGSGRVRGTVKCDRLTVSGNGVLQITENDLPPPPVNRPPTADAGADQTITLPADTISLSGTAADDGLPQGSALTYNWAKVSGPGPVSFADASAAATTAAFSVPGDYVLKLTASDGLLTASDTLNVTIVPRNQAPAVNAGPDQTVELPDEAALKGTVEDDALPRGSSVSINWSMVSGPGAVTFGNPAAAATSAAFSAPGDYVLRLSADDTEFNVSDELKVTVHPQNQPPTADAGPDLFTALPNGAALNGAVSDDGWPFGSALTSAWSKASGPGTVTFADPASPLTTAAFSEPGTYTLRLTASDTRLTAEDEVVVTVDPRNQAPAVNAGPDQTVELPGAAALAGAVTDDSYPRGSTVTQSWSVLSGPGNVTFSAPSAAATSAAFGAPGEYVLRLTASDTEFTVFDDVKVTVYPANQPPTADAGPDQTVRLPQAAALQGSVADDGWPFGSTLNARWEKVSGPGAVTFADPHSPATAAAFETAGAYLLRLSASDSRLAASDDVTVVVLPANVGPAADAGPDTAAQLRANLLRNGGNEEELFENRPAGWLAALDAPWLRGAGGSGLPYSAEGDHFFLPGEVAAAELTQDVDVSGFAASIASGAQQFEFEAHVRSRAGSAPDSCQVFVEYRDAANQNVLAAFDSGPLAAAAAWTPVRDKRAAPAGTAWIRVRLVSTRRDGLTNDAYFDAASLRAATGAGVRLAGRATDDGLPQGGTLRATWEKVSGPGTVTFADANSPATSATFTEPGDYVLRLTADDSEFNAGDEVTVRIGTANQPPAVEAGQEQTVRLPAAAALAGSATDDGMPNGSLGVNWSKAEGPGEVTFADPHSPSTSATFTEPGDYVLRLSAGDSEFTFHDEVVIRVKAANRAPEVNAGPDQSVTLPASATLAGSVTDDGEPAPPALALSWSVVSGPGTVTFADPSSAATAAAFETAGAYLLRLTASDSELTSSDDVTVVVAPEPINQPPTVNAGPDQSILLTDTAALQGSATDDGLPVGSALAYNWTKVSGPGTVTFADPAAAATSATFSEAGTYVLRLTANDSLLAAGDEVQVVVRRSPVAGFTVPGLARNALTYDNNVGSYHEGATVVSSSSQASTSFLPNFIIDDSHSTRWRSATGQIANQQITIHLPGAEPRAFQRVRLVNADNAEGVRNFRVLASTTTQDDDAFSLVLADAAINVATRVQEFVLPAPARARFVRFVAVDNHGSTTNVALRSFELVDDALAGVPSYFTYPGNAAAAGEGARVVAFSSQSTSTSLFATSAIDDNPNTAWLSASGQVANQFVTVELGLGKVYSVDRVRLFNFEGTSNRGVRDFRVEVSDTTPDAAGFRTVFTGTAQNAAGAQEFVFPQGATNARYVRLVAVNNHGSATGVELRELQVPPVPAAAPSASSYSDGDSRPELMLDDSNTTSWRTASGKVTDQHATFRLGAAGEEPLVEQALIQAWPSANADALKDFEVRVSATTADDAAFTTVLAGTVQNNGQLQKFAFPGGPVRARYARLVARNNHGGATALRVATFQLIASASEGNIISAPAAANVARLQSPSLVANGASVEAASGQLSASTGPAHMLDYAAGNVWSTPGTANHFAVVRLAGGPAHTLTGVRLAGRVDTTNAADSVKNFEVWVSATTADDAAFSKVLTATALNNRALQTFAFPAPAAARYVKYVPVNNYGSASTISTSNFDVIAEGAGGVVDFTTAVNTSNRPEFAIDGNSSSIWQTATGSVTNQWVTLALPGSAPQPVYGVRIESDSSVGPKEFEIRVSETTADPASFTTAYAGTLPSASGDKEYGFGSVRPARYVQFLWKTGYSTSSIAVRELEVLAVPRAGSAVVAFSSQSTSTTGPARALDYDRAGQPWLTASNQAANQFMTVALPRHEAWTVDHVALEPDMGGENVTPRNFEVQASTTGLDDASFSTVLTGALRNEEVAQHYFFAPTRARYVRLLLKDNYGGTQMRLRTFWVFSPQVGGLRARFLDRTKDGGAPIASYLWDFGDGQTSAERDPLHLFGAPGLYQVRLTVTDAHQLTSSHTIPYEAHGAPRVDFTFAPDPGREGDVVIFTDTSTDATGPAVAREWAWGDGSVSTANALAPTHTFRDNGGYSVTLTASDARGITDSATKTVPVVNLPPTVNAGSDHSVAWGQPWNVSASVSDPSSVDRTSLRCDWDYGDATSSTVTPCDSTAARAAHTYGAPGVYSAALTVTDKDGGAASDTVVVTATKRPTSVVYTGARSVQEGQPVTLRARLRDSLAWVPMAGKTVRFTLDSQTADAVTNADGDAQATIVYTGTASSHSITAAFAEDDLYLAGSATVAAACPAESQPVDAALVIDRSGSMSGLPLLDAQRGASIFVESLDLARDQVAVVSFESTAKVNLGLTRDGAAALNAINSFAVGGGTDIGSGIEAARIELTGGRRNPFAAPVMLVLSDGRSSGDPAAVAQLAKNAGIRVIAIGLGGVDEAQMKAIASSPSDYYFSASSANLGAIYSSIVSTLCKPANQPPAVNAGPDQTVALPNAVAALQGTVSDDGLPAGAPVASAWSVVSGPGPVTFADPHSPSTSATFTEPGAYVLRLAASDTQYSRSADVTVVVRQPLAGAVITLDPAAAGPNVTGTTQTLVATLKDRDGQPLAGVEVQFALTGPNATTYAAPTAATGAAAFTYTGRAGGTDVAQASAGAGAALVQSNASRVNWVTPAQVVSTTTVLGRFFTSNGSGVFGAQPTQTPAFSQSFPTVNFNPPAGTIPGNTSGVNPNTHPFTNVTTDYNGNFTGTIPAQGNGLQAGVGTLFDFNAVFTGTLTVAVAGDVTFNFFSDDGFIFGVGGGAARVGGANTNAPASGRTPFENYPVMGAYNVPTAPVANSITVRFPAPGTYPYEVDYSECCGGELSLTMTTAASGNRGVPPTGALTLTPNAVPQKTTGEQQTFQVAAVDASGAPLANLPVLLTVAGANTRQLGATTDAAGRASFSYTGQNPGTDSVQVSAPVGNMTAYSNVVSFQWKAAANQAPAVNAGPDQSVTLPANNVTLNGTVTDDGLPLGGALTASWTKVSGPGAVSFANPASAATVATFAGAGVYVLRLTASDSQLSASDDVTVSVNGVNVAPAVNAGPDQTIVLPANASLNGSVTDDGLPAGAAVTSSWTKVSGPGAVTFANPSSPATAATFGAAGAYVLRLTASDTALSASDEVAVNVLPPATPNAAPTVSAGADLSTAMGVNLLQNGGNEAALDGGEIPSWAEAAGTSWAQAAAGADGFPPAFEGATYFYAGDAAAAELRQDVDLSAFAATLGAGTQQFEFQARLRSRVESTPDAARVVLEYRSADNSRVIATLDSGPITYVAGWLTTEDTRAAPAGTGWIRIRLIAARNTGPTNDAYFDGVSLRAVSTAGVKLGGSVADDGLPSGSALASAWSVVSGPGPVKFANAGAAATAATFEAAGTYVLRLSATDSELSASDEVTVTVIPVNRAPVVNAGADQTITMPNETVLSGTVTDDNLPQGGALEINWTKVSGPGAVTFADPHSPETEATFGAEGTYVLRLSATDSELSASDDITITVKPTPPNLAPVANAGADQTITLPADTVTLAGGASDDGLPAGGALTTLWTKVSGPGNVTFGDAAALSTAATFSKAGVYVLRLTASDSQLSASDDVTVSVNGVNVAPAVSAGPDQTVTLPNRATLGGTADDDGLPLGSTLQINWAKVSGPGNVTFTNPQQAATLAAFSTDGTYVLRLTASDSEQTVSDDVTVTVNPIPPPPTVEFKSLADGEEVTAPKEIVGTVSGGAWRLEYTLLTDETSSVQNWRPISSGTNAVTNGVLGRFDPTTLVNGTYAIRLVSTDASGQTSILDSSVVVAGQMKIGHFQISFTDLSLPVAGIPVQVTRSYDSRDRRAGDFGAGWTLGITSARVQKTVPVGAHWYETMSFAGLRTYCLESTRPQIVSITFGDGKVYKFRAVPSKKCQQLVPLSTVQMTFVPEPGTRGALAPLDGGPILIAGSVPGPVDLVDINDPSGYYFNPTRFRLTTEDGTSFVLGQKTGVESVTTPAGDSLAITRDGITHSSGQSVVFVRDELGRIKELRDPDGYSRFYTYDANGDLVAFKDAEGATTRLTYEADHYLKRLEMVSADGASTRTLLTNEWSGGRLVKQFDADGKEVAVEHDLANRRETVRDRLGNPTVFEYDERGNVVYTKDAEGHETRRTYNSEDQVLTETTAVGTTVNTYDPAGNLAETKDPYGNVTKFTYNAMRRVTSVTDPLNRVTTHTYHATNGNLLKSVDAEGNEAVFEYEALGTKLLKMTVVPKEDPAHPRVVAYAYDRLGRLVRETDPNGNYTSFTNDGRNNRTSQTVRRARPDGTVEELTTSFEYDKNNRLVKTTYPDNTFTTVSYNELGKQSAVRDHLGRETRYEYDPQGRLVRTVYPDGKHLEDAYDLEGRRTSTTDRAGRVTAYKYDKVGRLTERLLADGARMTATYDALGRLLTQSRWPDAATKYTTTYRYEAEGRNRVVYATDAHNNVTKQVFDEAGNLWKVTDAKNHTTVNEYDKNNRVVKTTYHDGSFEAIAYNGFGQVAAKTDQAGRTTRYEYDGAGRLVKVTDAANKVTAYGYDELGRQTAQTDANLHTTSFEYDSMGRRTKRTLPEGMSELFTYDGAGRLRTRTDFNGKTTAYDYDSLNRLVKKTPDASFAQAPVTFTYTATGRRETMTDATGTTTYTYDDRDRLKSKAAPQGTLTYDYDKLGGLKSVRSSNPDGVSADYGYDELGRLSSVTDNRLAANNVTTYTYDKVGNLESHTYGNGVKSAYDYNPLNRLTTLTISRAATTLNSFAYTLGAAGNRESVTEADGRKVTYTYDELYRLKTETVTGDAQGANGAVSYTYDDAGNRLARASTLPGVADQSFTYDKNDRLASDGYDANGNTKLSNGVSFTYDWEDRLSTAHAGSVLYAYDGDGNRVSKTAGGVTTSYLVDENNPTGYAQVVEELRGGSVVRQYTYGNDLISQRQLLSGQWSVSYYGYDGHGSVRALTDESGAVTDTYAYDAFGALVSRTGSTPNEYLYAGERFDAETGLYYLRARYMNTATGRFWTRDTFEGSPADPVSLHKYLYASADPVDNIDPSGHFSISESMTSLGIMSTLGAITGILVNGINNYALGRPFFEGAAGAAAFGAAALPLATAFPILGVVLAGLGIYSSGSTAWQVFSNPNSSAGQKGAAIFLVGLSLLGAYGSARNVQENSLWVNAAFLESGGIAGSGKTGTMGRSLDTIRTRVSEFSDVLETQMPNQKGRITIGVGIAEDAAGQQHTLIGTSEARGYIRGPMRSLIQGDDIVVKGTGHAEADIVSFANAQGWKLIGVGATRPICGPCASDIAGAGATAATPLK